MPVMPTNFVESGGASAIVALAKDGGVPLVSEQKELTPFQRMVITKELARQQEELEKQRENQGTGRMHNSHSAAPSKPGGQMGGGETVEYINESVTDG